MTVSPIPGVKRRSKSLPKNEADMEIYVAVRRERRASCPVLRIARPPDKECMLRSVETPCTQKLTRESAWKVGKKVPELQSHPHRKPGVKNFLALAVGAIGVVFGDIGTSPIYTYSGIYGPGGLPSLESASGPTGSGADPQLIADEVTGTFSAIFWVLTVVVCLKYLLLVLRIDHNGEGGSIALMQAVLQPDSDGNKPSSRLKLAMKMMGMMGMSLLLGDGEHSLRARFVLIFY